LFARLDLLPENANLLGLGGDRAGLPAEAEGGASLAADLRLALLASCLLGASRPCPQTRTTPARVHLLYCPVRPPLRVAANQGQPPRALTGFHPNPILPLVSLGFPGTITQGPISTRYRHGDHALPDRWL